VWSWLAAEDHHPLLRLWAETYTRSLVDPDGAWAGFARSTVKDWLAVLANCQPPVERDGDYGAARRTLALTALRGALSTCSPPGITSASTPPSATTSTCSGIRCHRNDPTTLTRRAPRHHPAVPIRGACAASFSRAKRSACAVQRLLCAGHGSRHPGAKRWAQREATDVTSGLLAERSPGSTFRTPSPAFANLAMKPAPDPTRSDVSRHDADIGPQSRARGNPRTRP